VNAIEMADKQEKMDLTGDQNGQENGAIEQRKLVKIGKRIKKQATVTQDRFVLPRDTRKAAKIQQAATLQTGYGYMELSDTNSESFTSITQKISTKKK
jgi:hypothetical protein